MKKYKAIFFDWDGTAVVSRKAPVDEIIVPMKNLLKKKIPLVIISGTTYENIANGNLHTFFTIEELQSLFLGLGRGAFNYRYDERGLPYVWHNRIPEKQELLKVHDVCYHLHRELLNKYDIPTDIVFSRPNYCKIDLLVAVDRGEHLFFQGNELGFLNDNFERNGFKGGLLELIKLTKQIGNDNGISLVITSDAKYLEVGTTDKSDNVNTIASMLFEERNISANDCCFWGDEYIGLAEDIFGSDSFMITELTKDGNFYDVSDIHGVRPEVVQQVGGGVPQFISFLNGQL